MNIGLYLFLTFLVVMIFLINKDDEKQEKVKKIKKPNLDVMYQNSARELRDMFRESKKIIDAEYEKNFRK